jgi:hypothetical protein
MRSCAPYVCQDGTKCYSDCAAAGQAACSAGNTCTSGSCGPKQLGATCSTGSECASTNCVDGVCCESACTGPCVYCNQTSAPGPGHCVSVAMSQDPRSMCPAGSGKDATCTPGGCSGSSNSCLKAATNTGCGGSCNASGVPTSLMCDATGKCSQSMTGAACTATNCRQCIATSSAAACQAATDGTICIPASCDPGPNSATGHLAAKCTSGTCGTPQPVNCGAYACLYSDPSGCFNYCGCYFDQANFACQNGGGCSGTNVCTCNAACTSGTCG